MDADPDRPRSLLDRAGSTSSSISPGQRCRWGLIADQGRRKPAGGPEVVGLGTAQCASGEVGTETHRRGSALGGPSTSIACQISFPTGCPVDRGAICYRSCSFGAQPAAAMRRARPRTGCSARDSLPSLGTNQGPLAPDRLRGWRGKQRLRSRLGFSARRDGREREKQSQV